MKKYIFYPAVFQPEEHGGYSIFFPDIEGCNTQGKNVEDGYEMACDALSLMLEGLDKLPKPSEPEDIKLEKGQIIASIPFKKNKQ